MMATPYRTYTVEPGEYVTHSFNPFFLGVYAFNVPSPGVVPAWVTLTYDNNGEFSGYYFTAPITAGTYSFEFTVQLADNLIYATVTIIVDALAGVLGFLNCCEGCNIAWLNREGGIQNYLFSGVKTSGGTSGKAQTYKSLTSEGGKVLRYSERTDNYQEFICTTGDVPKSHVDSLDSLRWAIQAWLWNSTTDNWDIPIILNRAAFTKYKSNDKFYEASIRWRIAEEVLIQTQ